MITRASGLAVVLSFGLAGAAFAQLPEPPPLPVPESDVVCDNDTDPNTPGNQNACDCALPPSPDPSSPRGCVAVGPVCLAGDIPSLTGCLSIAGGANLCSNGPGAIAECDDATCAATASAGCGTTGSPLPELPAPPL
jgi:hypothetical protein